MSYPDEWEAEVERMMADLGPVDMPESVRLLNRVIARNLAGSDSILRSTIMLDTIANDRRRRRSWGESLWTARDLLRLGTVVPLVD